MLNTKIAGKFLVKKKIGSGKHSEIYLTKTLTEEEFALKVEKNNCPRPQLLRESKVLKLLQGGAGIPSIQWVGTEENLTLMVLELLGPSLKDLFQVCNQRLCLKTILMLAEQFLIRIEFLHSKSYVHRDIKPENFLVGLGKRSSLVYLIDFGMARKYRDSKTHQHIMFKEGKKPAGNIKFVSVYTHNGFEQSRRDDLIAIGYVLLHLLRGNLPWQGISSRDKNRLTAEKKLSIHLDELCAQHPVEFKNYLEYCISLKFEDIPDYMYLRRMFKGLYISSGFEDDFLYDWSLMNYTSEKKVKNCEDEEVKKAETEGRKTKIEELQVEKKKKKTCLVF